MKDPLNNNWINNPKLADIDKAKLEMLRSLASQGNTKGAGELLPFLLAAASQGKKSGMNFSASEISTIIDVLKAGKSPQEVQKLDKVIQLMKMIR